MTPPPTAASATVGRVTRPTRERRRSLPRPSLPRPSRSSIGRVGVASGGVIARAFVGRRLIGVLAAALIGLVFVQVTLLKLNTQISANAERSQLLTRQNAEQRAMLARLDAAQRVTGAADSLGLVMPAPDAVCYLTAGEKRACSVNAASAESLQNAILDPAASGDQTLAQTDQSAGATDQNTTDQSSTQPDQGTQDAGGSPQQAPGNDQTQSPGPAADAGSGGLVAGAGG